MRRIRATIILVLISVALLSCAAQEPAQPLSEADEPAPGAVIAAESRLLDTGNSRPVAGEQAPDFSYQLPDGSEVRLSDLRGTPVVLNFWATWCLPCIEEMPELQQAVTEADGKLVVLAVNRNELPAAIARFTHRVAVTFPLITDLSGEIGDRYGVTALPTTYFINSDGTIAARQLGALSPSLLEQHLADLR